MKTYITSEQLARRKVLHYCIDDQCNGSKIPLNRRADRLYQCFYCPSILTIQPRETNNDQTGKVYEGS